ncbi:PPOX class F420-dependent oxidoreductase [Actinomadura sp. DC4]|uniref:PPOX class F420-dependent oxidoreductase n=1 Tax=Actinomadura sp. DC4 TaxID=3055069 RepID=UPI0025B07F47|nr:PPOX class F420-dependent oxidoreductase [Actinomadura sp. DC4]MDN3355582.1 PPOX class F420-dependent oxidoreductase [Actinomadura sp. DC4]
MEIFTERELAYLREQRLGRLATVQPGGVVQNNPVGFGYNAELGTIDIGGHDMSASKKFRNVAAGSQVAFVVDDIASLDPWTVRCLEIRGDAEALTEPEDSAGNLGGPIIRVHPRRVMSFGIDPAPSRRTIGDQQV